MLPLLVCCVDRLRPDQRGGEGGVLAEVLPRAPMDGGGWRRRCSDGVSVMRRRELGLLDEGVGVEVRLWFGEDGLGIN